MSRIYIDCRNGISGDMLLAALIDAGADEEYVMSRIPGLGDDSGHRSYSEIKEILERVEDEKTREISCRIYEAIAVAEAEVHGEDRDDVHFHEVGRNEAVRNIIGCAACISFLDVSGIFCSEIHDGKGWIRCSHGVIPVPVPCVEAMKKGCRYTFVTDENVSTEMVTPTGLAILIGIMAEPCRELSGKVISYSEAVGTRYTGKSGGLRVYLLR